MINQKIALSALSIVTALVLTGGATYAYFTDSATSSGNSFSTGTLNINIRNQNQSQDFPFAVTNIAPGDTETRYITVVNDGTEDMQFRAYISSGDGGLLFNALRVQSVTLNPTDYPSAGYTDLTANGYTIAGPSNFSIVNSPIMLSSLTNPSSSPLLWNFETAGAFKPKWAAVYKVVVQMDPAAGNEYLGTSWTGDLKFDAIQTQDTTF